MSVDVSSFPFRDKVFTAGSGFAAVGEKDPVVGEIQRRYPGLRPVGFWSPYQAAAWTIIGHRIRITQAAVIKARMAEQLGEPVRMASGGGPGL